MPIVMKAWVAMGDEVVVAKANICWDVCRNRNGLINQCELSYADYDRNQSGQIANISSKIMKLSNNQLRVNMIIVLGKSKCISTCK